MLNGPTQVMLFRRSPLVISADLRTSLEAARFDLLGLGSAFLDQMDLTGREIPQPVLRQLFELDADYAEALWALDQPAGPVQAASHAAGYFGSLGTNARAVGKFRKMLSLCAHANYPRWSGRFVRILNPPEAYSMVPAEILSTLKHPRVFS